MRPKRTKEILYDMCDDVDGDFRAKQHHFECRLGNHKIVTDKKGTEVALRTSAGEIPKRLPELFR